MAGNRSVDVAFVWSDDEAVTPKFQAALEPAGFHLRCSDSLEELRREVTGGAVSVILAHDGAGSGRWKQVLDIIVPLDDKPSVVVVVASNATPEYWADALTRGAYDVIGPDDAAGLVAVVEGAQYRFERSREVRKARAASEQAYLSYTRQAI